MKPIPVLLLLMLAVLGGCKNSTAQIYFKEKDFWDTSKVLVIYVEQNIVKADTCLRIQSIRCDWYWNQNMLGDKNISNELKYYNGNPFNKKWIIGIFK